MPTVQLAGSAVGGLIQGAFGNYQPAADGTYTVDTRDAPPLLAAGMQYIKNVSDYYTLRKAPLAATTGQIVASGALSNGSVAVSNQPDVPRPVKLAIGTGTGAITGGNIAIAYYGNDGVLATENYSAVVGASAASTVYLTRGVAQISTIAVSGLVGGTAPFIRLDTTADLSVPVHPNTVDVVVFKEDVDLTSETVGPAVAGVLASLTPTTAPNATHTYGFGYSFVAPTA